MNIYIKLPNIVVKRPHQPPSWYWWLRGEHPKAPPFGVRTCYTPARQRRGGSKETHNREEMSFSHVTAAPRAYILEQVCVRSAMSLWSVRGRETNQHNAWSSSGSYPSFHQYSASAKRTTFVAPSPHRLWIRQLILVAHGDDEWRW